MRAAAPQFPCRCRELQVLATSLVGAILLSSGTRQSVAQFNGPFQPSIHISQPPIHVTHSCGRIWAGASGNHLYIITLEGAEENFS